MPAPHPEPAAPAVRAVDEPALPTIAELLRRDQRRNGIVLIGIAVVALVGVLVPWSVFSPRDDRLSDALGELVAIDETMRDRQLLVRTAAISDDTRLLTLEQELRVPLAGRFAAAEDTLRSERLDGLVGPIRAADAQWTTDVVDRWVPGEPFPLERAGEAFDAYTEVHRAAVDTVEARRDRLVRIERVTTLTLTGVVVAALLAAAWELQRRRRRLVRDVVEPLERLVVDARRIGSGDGPVAPVDLTVEDLRVLSAALVDLDAAVRERERLDQRARERDDRLRLAHDLSDIGFVVVDPAGNVLESNEAFARMLGRDAAELTGAGVTSFVHPDDVGELVEAGRSVVDGEQPAAEVELRVDSGAGDRWALVTISCSRDAGGAVTSVMAQIQDITDRRAAVEVQARYRRELERSNAELEQFAYVASHDLSEPLRVMSGFAELLRSDLGDGLSDETTRHLEYILDAAARMQRLIADLLAYSRVGRIEAPAEVVDVAEVARDVVALLTDDLADRPVSFVIDALPLVVAAPTHVRHLVLNLVANAVKFHATDRPPVVRIGSEPDHDGFAIVVVDDNGIGIEEKYRERIFRMFQRLHSRDEYPGTGMGLAICRKIADLYGGSLVATDSPLGGTRFVLRLPAVRPPADDVLATE